MTAESPTAISAHITAQTTLVPAINAWRYFLVDQGRSLHTVKAFTADLLLLAAYLPPDRNLGTITTLDLNHFLRWLQTGRGVPCSPKSLARRITSLKAFFRWLRQGGVLTLDPAEKVLQQSVISPMPEVLTPDEVKAVLAVADQSRRAAKPDARPYTLLALLLATGIKKGECLAISPNHLDLENADGAFLFVRYSTLRNRYKERKIDLSDEWIEVYREYAAQYPQGDRVFAWSPRRLEYLLEEIGQEAGLKKHLSFDMCRWTCALTDYKNEMEPEMIRQKLGISKIQWREIHLKLRNLAKPPSATPAPEVITGIKPRR
ncbi:MAG: site-specific integrase [Anaerolineaceae bacterium]|nr:site-specific integrase [Anaerolineaceae bacterium]